MKERPGIAGSGAIACGLAATAAAMHDDVRLGALRGERATARAGRSRRSAAAQRRGPGQRPRRHGPRPCSPPRPSWSRRSSRSTTPRPSCSPSSTLRRPRRRPGHHDLVAVGDRARPASGAPRSLRRPARVQPGAEDEARRARLPHRVSRRRATARGPSAPTSARRPSRSRTSRASWSTACCSRTCSAPSTSWSETGMAPRRSTRACASAPATRWARWPCSTSSASTSRRDRRARSASRSLQRIARSLVAEGATGRKAGRGFHTY